MRTVTVHVLQNLSPDTRVCTWNFAALFACAGPSELQLAALAKYYGSYLPLLHMHFFLAVNLLVALFRPLLASHNDNQQHHQ